MHQAMECSAHAAMFSHFNCTIARGVLAAIEASRLGARHQHR